VERPSEPGAGTIAGGGPGDSLTAVAPEAGTIDAPPPATASVARQRWRLVLARDAGPEAVTGRELAVAWDDAIEETGLPVHRPAGRTRARIAFGAPVPAAMTLERELADLVLAEFVPRWRVREALDGRLPDGWRLVDLYDVWPGAPALAGQVVAADYRFELDGQDPDAVAKAAAGLLASDRLPRERRKGTDTVEYDLRPLLADVAITSAGPPVVVRARTRFDPVFGTGRPEEVVAALGDRLGVALEPRSIVRERVLLAADDLEKGGDPAHD
jgi:hypothetical protein